MKARRGRVVLFYHSFSFLRLLPFDAVAFRNLESPQLAAANYDQLPIFL